MILIGPLLSCPSFSLRSQEDPVWLHLKDAANHLWPKRLGERQERGLGLCSVLSHKQEKHGFPCFCKYDRDKETERN